MKAVVVESLPITGACPRRARRESVPRGSHSASCLVTARQDISSVRKRLNVRLPYWTSLAGGEPWNVVQAGMLR